MQKRMHIDTQHESTVCDTKQQGSKYAFQQQAPWRYEDFESTRTTSTALNRTHPSILYNTKHVIIEQYKAAELAARVISNTTLRYKHTRGKTLQYSRTYKAPVKARAVPYFTNERSESTRSQYHKGTLQEIRMYEKSKQDYLPRYKSAEQVDKR